VITGAWCGAFEGATADAGTTGASAAPVAGASAVGAGGACWTSLEEPFASSERGQPAMKSPSEAMTTTQIFIGVPPLRIP
jgi:hypothetical protein